MSAPTFDHRDAGTDESRWGRPTASLPDLQLPDRGRVVVVAAHPDDETLGAGGLIAAASAAGLSVTVLVATGGERSHPRSPTHTPAELARTRRAEVFEAVGRLAPTAALRQLALPDGDLDRHRDTLVSALTEIVDADTLLVTPWAGDGHPDHTAAAEAAHAVATATGARHWQYPIWLWHWGSPDDLTQQPWHRLVLTPSERRLKEQVLQTHGSQVRPLSDAAGDETLLTDSMLDHFRRQYEVFLPDGSPTGTVPVDFESFWARSGADPWGYRTRWYEERKRAVLLGALPRRRFRSAFEPGCATGELTAELASRCDQLLSADVAEAPLARARDLLTNAPHVRLRRMAVPQDWPDERVDLIVLSEIGYYCSASDWREVVRRTRDSLTEDGVVVACHWRYPVPESGAAGDDVHRVLRRESGLRVLVEHLEPDFRLTVLAAAGVPTPAQADGLVGRS